MNVFPPVKNKGLLIFRTWGKMFGKMLIHTQKIAYFWGQFMHFSVWFFESHSHNFTKLVIITHHCAVWTIPLPGWGCLHDRESGLHVPRFTPLPSVYQLDSKIQSTHDSLSIVRSYPKIVLSKASEFCCQSVISSARSALTVAEISL